MQKEGKGGKELIIYINFESVCCAKMFQNIFTRL